MGDPVGFFPLRGIVIPISQKNIVIIFFLQSESGNDGDMSNADFPLSRFIRSLIIVLRSALRGDGTAGKAHQKSNTE
jgi:hypothetical protein